MRSRPSPTWHEIRDGRGSDARVIAEAPSYDDARTAARILFEEGEGDPLYIFRVGAMFPLATVERYGPYDRVTVTGSQGTISRNRG